MARQDRYSGYDYGEIGGESANRAEAALTARQARRASRYNLAQLADQEQRAAMLEQAYRDSTDEAGQLDEQSLYKNLAKSGQAGVIPKVRETYDTARTTKDTTAYNRDAAADEQQRKNTQTNVEVDREAREAKKDETTRRSDQLKLVSGRLAGLVDAPDLNHDTVKLAVKGLLDEGSIDEPTGQRLIQGAPQDPAQIRRYVRNLSMEAMDAGKRWDVMNPKSDEPTAYQKMQDDTTRRGQDFSRQTAKDTLAAKATSAKNPKSMTATAQKELFTADRQIQAGNNVVGSLQEALKLNDSAYESYGAKIRAEATSFLGGSKGADATIDLDNIMTGQALESLKTTFGGQPTEGERKILLDMQASVSKTAAQRKPILERAAASAKRRIAFETAKAKALRDGTYFTSEWQYDDDWNPPGDDKPPEGDLSVYSPDQLLKMLEQN